MGSIKHEMFVFQVLSVMVTSNFRYLMIHGTRTNACPLFSNGTYTLLRWYCRHFQLAPSFLVGCRRCHLVVVLERRRCSSSSSLSSIVIVFDSSPLAHIYLVRNRM